MHDQGDDHGRDHCRQYRRRMLHQHIDANQDRHDRTANVHRYGCRGACVANRYSVADTETVDDLIRIKLAALDFGNRDVDIAAEETGEECEKRQIGRQAEHLERTTDQANLDQDEKEAEDKKEDNRVEDEEWCEEHRARIARRRIPSQPQNRTAPGKESVLLSGGSYSLPKASITRSRQKRIAPAD